MCTLNNTRLKDKINTKSIASKLNMLSVNQINAQVKLTEMWKATNVSYYPIPLDKKAFNDDSRLTRSITRGDIVLQGRSELCNSSFMFDASKIWNNAPSSIKECNSIYKAKKEIKKFVSLLPLWRKVSKNLNYQHNWVRDTFHTRSFKIIMFKMFT